MGGTERITAVHRCRVALAVHVRMMTLRSHQAFPDCIGYCCPSNDAEQEKVDSSIQKEPELEESRVTLCVII